MIICYFIYVDSDHDDDDDHDANLLRGVPGSMENKIMHVLFGHLLRHGPGHRE